MTTQICGRNFSVTETHRSFIQRKLRRIERRLSSIDEISFTLSAEKLDHVAEVNLRAGKISAFAKSVGGNMLAAIETAIDKIDAQIKKAKNRREERRRVGRRARVEVLDGEALMDAADLDDAEPGPA